MASIVQTPSGTYQAVIRRKGHKPIKKAFARKTDANNWAKSIETAISKGEYSPDRPTARITFAELLQQFNAAEDGLLAMTDSGQAAIHPRLAHWLKQLGHMRLLDITPEAIEQASDKLATRRKVSRAGNDLGQISLSTLKRDLSALASVFKWAAKKRIIRASPMREVAKPEVNDQRERYLSADELTRLLQACDQSESAELGLAVRLALFTGMRQSNVMQLQWGRINLSDQPILYTATDGRMFTIPPHHCLLPTTKNGNPHLAPLEGEAYTALHAWQANSKRTDPAALVFPGRHNIYQPLDLRTPWLTALKRAAIEGFRWHDLRHSFASMMLQTGISHLELAKLTGHKDMKSLMRYAHIAPEHSSGLVAKMQEALPLKKTG